MKLRGNAVAGAIIFALASATQADDPGDRPLDKDFLVKVATCSNAGLEISKLAEKKASSPEVKEFAVMLNKEHKAAYDKLGDLLKNRKVGTLAGLEKETRDEIKRLGDKEGKEFDRAFLEHMIREHKKAIAMVENQAQNGKEADIRDFAKGVLPDLRKHLKKAEELATNSSK